MSSGSVTSLFCHFAAIGQSSEPASFGAADSIVHTALEQLRRHVERLDDYQGTVLLHSLAGGTGSGLGTRLLEELRDLYPLHFLTAVTVTPFAHGESSLQHFNTVCAMTCLQVRLPCTRLGCV